MSHTASTFAIEAIGIHQKFEGAGVLQLKRLLWKSGGTALAGLVATVGILLFMALGPELEIRSAVFASFLLLCAACLLVGGMMAFISPVLDWLTYNKFQELSRVSEDLEDLELRHRVGATLREVYRVGGPQVRSVIETQKESLELFSGEEIVGAGANASTSSLAVNE